MAKRARPHPTSQPKEPPGPRYVGQGVLRFCSVDETLSVISKSTCPHCAGLAHAVMVIDESERTFDQAWLVLASACGCPALPIEVRDLAKRSQSPGKQSRFVIRTAEA